MSGCLIFDLDGTLVDSRADLCTGVNLMRREFGLPPLPPEQVGGYLGNGTVALCERSLAGTGVDPVTALPLMKHYYSVHLLDQTRLYPGVAETLRRVDAAGWRLAVVSNKLETPCRDILDGLGVGALFPVICGGDSGFGLKPAPEPLFHVLETLQVAPEESYMVGDNYTDLAAGRAAGVGRIFAAYGFGAPHGETCDRQIQSFSELTTI
ncbi:MAG: HAD-IA family hydrolase, partial [Victivallales bacterium]|nr:HAD-IA family hydrolase [Victivallales bacterium]